MKIACLTARGGSPDPPLAQWIWRSIGSEVYFQNRGSKICISYDVPSRETERTKSSLLLRPEPVEGLVAWFLLQFQEKGVDKVGGEIYNGVELHI
jgi:hypothetical protein